MRRNEKVERIGRSRDLSKWINYIHDFYRCSSHAL